VPFSSKAQARWMFATHPGMARRWADHTASIKKLPDHVGDKGSDPKAKPDPKPDAGDATAEKKAFAAAFILKCAAAGITDPGAVAAAAEAALEATRRMVKRAVPGGETAGDLVGRLGGAALLAPVVGSVGMPMVGGFALGGLAAGAKNQADTDDAETMRIAAQSNAYRRRAALAAAHAQVRKLLVSDPSKYVQIG
jgi:hypothetical protein